MFWERKVLFQPPGSLLLRALTADKSSWNVLEGGMRYSDIYNSESSELSIAKKQLLVALNITGAFSCEGAKDYLCYAEHGDGINPHTDMVYLGYMHRRLLVVLQECKDGGCYGGNGEFYKLRKNVVYELEADRPHELTPVQGDKALVLLVMSYITAKEKLDV